MSILPSFLKRKRGSAQSNKRRKTLQTWDRDIICIPKQDIGDNHISYPRGKYREELGKNGLIGKIRLHSNMSVDDVKEEIYSVFKPMNNRHDFLFCTYSQLAVDRVLLLYQLCLHHLSGQCSKWLNLEERKELST